MLWLHFFHIYFTALSYYQGRVWSVLLPTNHKIYMKTKIILLSAAALLLVGVIGTSAAKATYYHNDQDDTMAPATATTTPEAQAFCSDLASRIGGLPIPNGDVCDVVVVRKAPTIMGQDGMNLNKFTLMNSVLEFTRANMPSGQVYVMGDFALLETEMNNVLNVIKSYGWTVTGIHNHMILETPKTTFVHWEAMGDTNALVSQINRAFQETSIK
jgi:hypothetical protein